jgi:hypothetical protein
MSQKTESSEPTVTARPRFHKVLVCGGRNYDNWILMDEILHSLKPRPTMIIAGGARGADQGAYDWARTVGIPTALCEPNWGAHGKGAGPRRNLAMLQLWPDLVVAFPGGRGTRHMVEVAQQAGITIMKVGEDGKTTYIGGNQEP